MTLMRRPLALSTLMIALTACGADSVASPTGLSQTGGWLTLTLSTPNANDGAVQFDVQGPAVDSVQLTNYDGFSVVSARGADLVVTGQVTSGDVARIHIPDIAAAASYRATVTAAAALDSYDLQDVDGYRAALVH